MIYFVSNEKTLLVLFCSEALKLYRNFRFMFLIKMINFCKGADCPTSQDILACQKNEMPLDLKQAVDIHVSSCDFCGAEADVYSRYSLDEESTTAVEIPIPLLQLAESLLNNKSKGNHLLRNLLIENEDLALKEV